MADDLNILVGGDISPLEDALREIIPVAQNVASQIDQALASTTGASTAEDSYKQLADSLAATGTAANTAAGEIQQVTPPVNEAGNAAHDASVNFADLGEKLLHLVEAFAIVETMKEFAAASLEAYGNVQKVEISLTALTGSADQAVKTIEDLKALALSDALNFESLTAAAQKMTALGFSADEMSASLKSAADAAAATGVGFDQAANAIDRVALSGMTSGRILATLGLSVKDLATAMNVTTGEVAAAFKALDQSERIDVLNTALEKFAGVAEQTATGILGQWQNLKTEWGFALEAMGAAIAPVAQDLMNLAKSDIIPFLQGAIEAFGKLPGPMKDAAVAATAAAVAFGAMWLAFGGPAALALAAAGTTALMTISTFKSIGSEWHDTVALITGSYSDMDAAVKASTEKLEAGNASITKNTQSFINAKDPINQVAAAYNALQKAASDAQTQFDKVSAAITTGHATLSQYTTALNALDAAQKEANNGLQTASTVLLLVENAFVKLNVDLQNAATNLKETVAAYDKGLATWQQYVTALEAFDKAQEAANGGLLQLATAEQLVNTEQEALLISAANAETKFLAVAEAFQRGAATSKQYTDALNAMDAAQRNVNNGIESFKNALLIAEDSERQLAIAATNASTALQAQLAVYQRTGEGLTLVIDKMDQFVKSQEAANNGALTWAAAQVQVAEAEAKAQLKLDNTNMALAAASDALAKGAIDWGVYQKFVEAATKAHDDLTGATKKSADAATAAVPAHNSLASAAKNLGENFKIATGQILSSTDATNQVAEHYRQLQINLLNAHTELDAVQAAYDRNQASGGMLVGALQNLIKAQEALGGSTNTTTGAIASQINELRNEAGESDQVSTSLINIGTAAQTGAANAVSAINSIGTAINSVAGDAFAATQALDNFFNTGKQPASGSISFNPGDQLTQNENGISNTITLGSQQQLLAMRDKALQAVKDHIAATQNQTAATVSNTQAVTTSTAQSAADAAKIAAGNAAIQAAADAAKQAADAANAAATTVGSSIQDASSAITDAAGAVKTAVTLGTAILAPLADALANTATMTTTPLALGQLPGTAAGGPTDVNTAGKTLTGLAQTGSVVMNINVTGNTVTSQSQAQALANTIMTAAISRLRTVAGLKINV